MGAPEPEDRDLPFARSSISAIGARRRWRFFGGVVEDDPSSDTVSSGTSPAAAGDDGPPGRSMLSLSSGFSGPPAEDADAARFLKEARAVADEEPPVRSMLGSLADEAGTAPLETEKDDETGRATMLSLDGTKPAAPADEEGFGHLTQHSTIGELAGLEEHVANEWPIERGVLISLLFHISLMLMLIFFPARLGSRGGDLFAMLEPEPKDNTPIPVILDAPGPKRANPKPAPLSDADRRAGGGDRSKPKSDTPFIPKTNGIEGLAQGPRGPKVPGSAGPNRPAQQAIPPQQARGNQAPDQTRIAEKSPDAKSSEFPTETQQGQTGPREIGKLANLGQAIQDAARGAVTAGGEGGAPPPNPDGGFVDSGPVSFDTKWYDWGAYAAEMIRRIKLHWEIPELARLGWKGSLTVRFYIMADGTVADPKIIRVSGVPPFDNAAFQAIVKSSPFRPLPEVLHEAREGVTVTFFYNMRPEQEEARAQP